MDGDGCALIIIGFLFPFPAGIFDVIVYSMMLEHSHHPRCVLEHIFRLADENTRIVVSVPLEKYKGSAKKRLHRLGLLSFFSLDFSRMRVSGLCMCFPAGYCRGRGIAITCLGCKMAMMVMTIRICL